MYYAALIAASIVINKEAAGRPLDGDDHDGDDDDGRKILYDVTRTSAIRQVIFTVAKLPQQTRIKTRRKKRSVPALQTTTIC